MQIENQFQYSKFYPNPQPALQFVKWLADFHHFPIDAELLDIGCGFGRMFAGYNTFGWSVTAIEPDFEFYTQAKIQETLFPRIIVKQGGFLDIDEQERYDLAVAINDPFAYMTSFFDRLEALQRIYRALKKGGLIILDVPNFIYVLAHYKPPEDRLIIDSKRTYRRVTHQFQDFHRNTWTNFDEYHVVDEFGKETKRTKVQKLAMLNYPELEYILSTQGFKEIKTYNNYNSREAECLTGKRILVSAQKIR